MSQISQREAIKKDVREILNNIKEEIPYVVHKGKVIVKSPVFLVQSVLKSHFGYIHREISDRTIIDEVFIVDYQLFLGQKSIRVNGNPRPFHGYSGGSRKILKTLSKEVTLKEFQDINLKSVIPKVTLPIKKRVSMSKDNRSD